MRNVCPLFLVLGLLAFAKPASAQIKYFGYFGSEFIGSCGSPGCGAETAGHTNAVWIFAQVDSQDASCGSPWTYEWQCKILSARARHQKTVLAVISVLVNTPTSGAWSIRSNAVSRWATLSSAVEPLMENVIAFYVVDEPFYRAIWQGMTATAMKSLVESANAIIKDDSVTEETPIAVVFGPGELFNDFPGGTIPEGYDWVGFDCYSTGTDCWTNTLYPYTSYSYQEVLDQLESLMDANQRVIFIPDGTLCDGSHDMCSSSRTEAVVRDRVDGLMEIAFATENAIGIFPYTWSSYQDVSPFGYTTGTRDMSGLRSDYISIGQTIISAPYMYIDDPHDNSTEQQNFLLRGWAVDLGALDGNGVDLVHVWAFPVGGGSGYWLGESQMNESRPDLGAILGAQFSQCGFNFNAPTLPAGTYTVVVYAHSAVTSSFNQWMLRTITVQ